MVDGETSPSSEETRAVLQSDEAQRTLCHLSSYGVDLTSVEPPAFPVVNPGIGRPSLYDTSLVALTVKNYRNERTRGKRCQRITPSVRSRSVFIMPVNRSEVNKKDDLELFS